MKKIAFLGDPHAKLNNLNEISSLIDFIISLKKEGKVTDLCILGDLFDTHSVVRLETWDFWKKQLEKLSKSFSKDELAIISGNHDQPGSKERENISAISTLDSSLAHLVTSDPLVWNGMGLIPFTSSEDEFIQKANTTFSLGAKKYLVCHQTFNGAMYDNGMYAPDGYDHTKIPQEHIISGHIHTSMRFDKVFYTGTARWDSASDANKEKGIYVLSGAVWDFFDTSGVVPAMFRVEVKEGDEIPELKDGAKYSIHLIGTSKWVTKTKPLFKNAKIKTTYTDSLLKRSKEKVDNFNDFLSKASVSVNKDDILLLLAKLQ